MSAIEKLKRETDIDRLNSLIDWYERFKPQAGKRIKVDVGPKRLAKMTGHQFKKDEKGKALIEREIHYRGRVVVAVGADSER